MLSSLRVRNFRCILNLQMQFTYDLKQAPRGWKELDKLPFIEDGGGRLMPCMALYGPNASGKSTIILAIATLADFARGRVSLQSFYRPYCFN